MRERKVNARERQATWVAVVDGEMNFMPDKQVLFEVGRKMLLQATSSQPLSLLVVVIDDLPELEMVFGEKAAREAIDKATAELRRLTTKKGAVLWTSPSVCAVLLPGFTRDQAVAAVADTLGNPLCIEFDADDHEIVLVPEFRVETVGDESSVEELYESICRDIDQVLLSEQSRQKYLEHERESHVQHAQPEVTSPGAAATHPAKNILTPDYPSMPATMAVPLGGR